MAKVMLRRETDYAMRALAGLAKTWGGRPEPARRIAARGAIPEDHLRKLLQRLARAGFVSSEMGKKGGFRLVRDPRTVTLLDIAEAIQGPLNINICYEDHNACPRRGKCQMHRHLAGIQATVRHSLSSLSLRELAADPGSPGRVVKEAAR